MNNFKIFLFSLSFIQIAQAGIHGGDDRILYKDLETFNPVKLAKGTATQINKKLLKNGSDDSYFLYPTGHWKKKNQCPGEKHEGINYLGDCSGFLIEDDILVTAGHCFAFDTKNCSENTWLFNHYQNPSHPQTKLLKENIYHCEKLLDYRRDSEADYAVIKLDRKVKDSVPFKVDLKVSARLNDPLSVLGYPLGLPFTYTPGGRITSIDENIIIGDSDALTKNSGSPAFNMRTGKVEGVLTNATSQLNHFDSVDGCHYNKKFTLDRPGKTKINRLKRIPYINQRYNFDKKSGLDFKNNCQEDIELVVKYRGTESGRWITKDYILKDGLMVNIGSDYSKSVYVNARGLISSKKLLKGRDFYGFKNSGRRGELGFKKIDVIQNKKINVCD